MRLAVFIICVIVVSCQPPAGKPSQAQTVPPDDFGAVPAFSLTERGGKIVSNDALKGQVWVASFVFTRCTGSCPQVAASLAKLQEEFKDTPGVKFVTFTIDPERDQLDDLKKYAERDRADADRWLFLTGPEKTIHELASGGFKLAAARSKNPKPGDEFDHSSKLALVDQAGHIRGYYDGMPITDREGGQAMYDESQKKLRATIATLLKSP